jgi:hypothetical protein
MTSDPVFADLGDKLYKFEGKISDADSEYTELYDDEDKAFEICEM